MLGITPEFIKPGQIFFQSTTGMACMCLDWVPYLQTTFSPIPGSRYHTT
jgi:hypothetical protein